MKQKQSQQTRTNNQLQLKRSASPSINRIKTQQVIRTHPHGHTKNPIKTTNNNKNDNKTDLIPFTK